MFKIRNKNNLYIQGEKKAQQLCYTSDSDSEESIADDSTTSSFTQGNFKWLGCIFERKINELHLFTASEISAFSFSAKNISFASDQSSITTSILNESSSHNNSSNGMDAVHNWYSGYLPFVPEV